jgi:hypothetical protein
MTVIYLLSLERRATRMGRKHWVPDVGHESFLLAGKLQAADAFTGLALSDSSLGLEAERKDSQPPKSRPELSP